MDGEMGIKASLVITRSAEMPTGRLVQVLLEVDGIELADW